LAEQISQRLSENNKYYTIIEVVDFVNFLVIKGFTNNQKVFSLSDFKQEFMKEEKDYLDFLGLKILNFIDLIDYKTPANDFFLETPLWFEFWNSKRPLYHSSVIEGVENKTIDVGVLESIDYTDKIECETLLPYSNVSINTYLKFSNLSISSNFPFGYSLDCGKTSFYYCEYISNQLFSVLNTDKIRFKITTNTDVNNDLDITIEANSQYKDEDVKSMVLDIFDFNLTKFENDYLKDFDFTKELSNPFGNRPWIKRDKVGELIFI